MNTKKIHLASVYLTLLSLLLEIAINQGWIETGIQGIVFGISLGLMLLAMGLNVKVIRTMGVPEKAKKTSQLLTLAIAVYAFLVYGLEVI